GPSRPGRRGGTSAAAWPPEYSQPLRRGCRPDRLEACQEGSMKVAIVFDTRTGTTAAAAERMAEVVRAAGHDCTAESVARADPKAVARADAQVIGAWTRGWFVIRQHPSEGALRFIEQLPLKGRPVA